MNNSHLKEITALTAVQEPLKTRWGTYCMPVTELGRILWIAW